MKITYTSKKALRYLRDGNLSSRQFAKLMWPDSPYWKIRNGNRIVYAAGMYLRKLRKADWVFRSRTYGHVDTFGLTEEGKKALNE